MEVIKNMFLGLVMALILYILVQSISVSITNGAEFEDKTQKIFIINFIIGIVLIISGNTIFGKRGSMKNKSVQYGVIFGGISLMINTVVMNWDYLSDATRVSLIGLLLLVVVWYAYYRSNKKEQIEKMTPNVINTDDVVDIDDDGEIDREPVVHHV